MNRKARRRAIFLLERRRLLQSDAASGRDGVGAAEPFRFSLAYGADLALGKRSREPHRECQSPSER
jgi:hypothetical protein